MSGIYGANISSILNLTKGFNPITGTSPFSVSWFQFPGGELQLTLKRNENFQYSNKVTITHRLNSSDDLILLCLAVDSLRNQGIKEIEVFIPYFPYARQDRVNNQGEAFSLKVITSIINNLKLDRLSIFDPHSDVVTALLDNVHVLDNSKLVNYFLNHQNINSDSKIRLVSPDAGAYKKIFKLVEKINYTSEILIGSKHRDTKTGKILKTEINASTSELDPNQVYCVIDDICDGGATFIELGKALQAKGAKRLMLIVSHGIFSKGFEELEKYYEKIISTDSINCQESHCIRFNEFLK